MAHYALIDSNNIVVDLFVGRDEDDLAEGVADWEDYYAIPGYYVRRYSYNTHAGVHYDPETGEPSDNQSKAFRYNAAGLGFTFDPEKGTDGAFIPSQPFASWVLTDSCEWEAPKPMPEEYHPNGKQWPYEWNESSRSWLRIKSEGSTDSWTFDEVTKQWSAPTPYPADNGSYTWDEAAQNWVPIPTVE